MREFDGRGYSWRVETLYDRDHSAPQAESEENQFHRKAFEVSWGEQYEWTCMLPIAWKLIGTSDTRIRPSASDNQRDPSWWFTPLHLLGLGLGWTDIGKGLYEWERQGYPQGAHPILDFIYNTWGESIGALQAWLRIGYFSEDIEGPLAALRDSSHEQFRLDPIKVEEDEYYEETIRYLESRGVSGRRLDLARHQLFGGTDPFHLSMHFKGSIWPNDDEYHMAYLTDDYSEEDNDAFAINPEEYLWEAHFGRYAGFHVQLNLLAAGMMTGEAFSGKECVRVHVRNFGYLGEFMRHEKTRRWFLFSQSDYARVVDAHLWGN